MHRLLVRIGGGLARVLVAHVPRGLDGEERSLREIGATLGVSGGRVRQLEQRVLGKLAAAAGAESVTR